MTSSDVIGTRFETGFSPDRPGQSVLIGRNRWLRQKVVVWKRDSEFHYRGLWLQDV